MNIPAYSPRARGGYTTLVVLVLLGIMAGLALGNNRVLRQLQKEIRLIEQKQLKRENTSPSSATRSPLAQLPGPPARAEAPHGK